MEVFLQLFDARELHETEAESTFLLGDCEMPHRVLAPVAEECGVVVQSGGVVWCGVVCGVGVCCGGAV